MVSTLDPDSDSLFPKVGLMIQIQKGGSEDLDPLFPNVDPRIRIHVKMRWIRNAVCFI